MPLRALIRACLTLVLLTAPLSASLDAHAQSRTVPAPAIDTLFAAWDTPTTPGAAVAVLQGDSVVYAQGYGMADLEHGVEVTPETVFLIASVSKQFTAFAIALLAERGLVDLDADVRTYVPEMHAFDPPITVRQLVHHTSGLRDEFDLLGMAGWRMDDVITKEHILQLAYRQRGLNFPSGTAYSYSNTGYTLMAEIVERVTGQTLRQFLDAEVFVPLGMMQTHVHDDRREIDAGRAQGYERKGEGWTKQLYTYESVGASGVFTTVLDLAKWVRNYETAEVGGPSVMAQMHERGLLTDGDTLSYAFGIGHGTHKGHPRVAHGGWHRGFRTYMLRLPEDDLAVIVFANTNAYDPSEKAYAVADLFLAPGAEALAAYAGRYYSEELDTTYTLVVKDGALVSQHRRNDPFTLSFDGPDRFTTDAWYFDEIVFERDGEAVTGFHASTNRARDVHFVKQ